MKPSADQSSEPSTFQPQPSDAASALSDHSLNLTNNNGTMEDTHQQILQRHYQTFTESLDVSLLFPTLHAHKLLTMDEITSINKLPTTHARAQRLLDLLPNKGPHAFQGFCKSLETNYPHLLAQMFISANNNNSGSTTGLLNTSTTTTSTGLSTATSMSTSLTSDSDEDTLNGPAKNQMMNAADQASNHNGNVLSGSNNVMSTSLTSTGSTSRAASESPTISLPMLRTSNTSVTNQPLLHPTRVQHNVHYDLQQNNQALLQSELKLVTADRDTLRNENLKLKSKLNSYKSLMAQNVDPKDQQVSGLDYDWLKSQCERAMSELQSLKRQHGESVKKCDQAMKETEYYRERYKDANEKYEQSNNELLSWKAQYDDLVLMKTRLQQEVTDLQTLHQSDLQQIDELHRQQRDVINESGSSEILNRMYDTAIGRNDLLRTDYDNMRKRYADLSAVHSLTLSKTEILQDEIQTLKKQLEEVFCERNGLKQQCTAFMRNWDNALRECNELKDTLHRVTQQKDSYLKEMNEVCAIRLKASKDLQRVTEERNAAVKEYSLIMSERDTVHLEIEQLQEKLCQTSKKSSNLDRERKLLSDELETLRREISSALSDRDRALKECHDLRARYGDIVVERESVRKERDEFIKDYKLMAQERDVARKERHEALEHRDQILRETYQKVRLEMAEEKDQVTKEVDNLRRDMEKLRKELSDALQEVDVSKRRRDWAFGERDKIVLERESMRTLCDNLRHERDRAVTELAESLRDSDDLRKQKNDLTKEIKELREKCDSLMEGGKISYPRLSHNHSDDSAIDTDMPPEWVTDTYQVIVDTDDGANYGFDLVMMNGVQSSPRHQPGGATSSPTSGGGTNKENDRGYYISATIKGSNADGKLRCYDQVLKVNNVDITNLEKSTVNDLIYTSLRQVSLLIRRRRATTTRPVLYVQLSTNDGNGSGVQLDVNYHVTRVQPGSQAAREGTVAVGDKVVSVNGTPVERWSVSELTRLLSEGRDAVLLGVVKPTRSTPSSSASSSKHNLIESPMVENRSLPHSDPSSPAKKPFTDKPVLKSSSSQTDNSDARRREVKNSHDNILDRAYEKIMGKFKRGHEKDEPKPAKSGGNVNCEQVIGELDSVLDNYDQEKRVVDSGTWPKIQSPASPTEFTASPSTVIMRPKVKERSAIPFFDTPSPEKEKHRTDGGSPRKEFDPRRSAKQESGGTLTRQSKSQPRQRPVSDVFERKHDSIRFRSSFDQKHAPLPPERSDASFAASVRHSPRSSFNNFTKSSPYLSSLAKHTETSEPVEESKTFSDHNLTHSNTSRQVAEPSDHVIAQSGHVVQRHVVTPETEVSAQRDRDIMERYSRKRPKSAPSRRHERRGVRRQTQQHHDVIKPTSITVRPSHPNQPMNAFDGYDVMTSMMTSSQEYVMTSPGSGADMTSLDGMISAGSSRYSTLTRESANALRPIHQAPLTQSPVPLSPSSPGADSVPPQYSPPPSYMSHMENVLSASFPDCDLAPPPYHGQGSQGNIKMRYTSSPIHVQTMSQRTYTPSPSDEICYRLPSDQPNQRPKSTGHIGSGDGFSTFPKRHTERIRIPSKSSIGRMSTSSIDGDSNSLVYDLTSQSSTASLPRAGTNHRPRCGETMNIHIEKSSEPLGIQIRRASSGGIFVSSVNNNSLASRAGITVGHQLLEVCGLNMRTATYQQAANILRQCGNSITMLAQYNPELFEEVGEDGSWCSGSNSALSDSRATSRQTSATSSPTSVRRDNQPEVHRKSSSHSTHTSHSSHSSHTSHTNHSVQHGGQHQQRHDGSSESINSVTPTNSPQLSRKQPSSVRRAPYMPPPEPRYVRLKRPNESAPLGIGLIGGNAVGIYVNDVKKDSVAQGQDGLRTGDRLLEINGIDVRACTAEQAAYELSRPNLTLSLMAQYSYNDFVRVKDEAGDAFYVRAMFDRPADVAEGELIFKQGDILFVENTVCGGEIGLWKAWLVDENGNKITAGTVLGRTRLEEDSELLHSISEAAMDSDTFKRRGSGSFRRSFFRRRRHQRNNSKDSRDLTYCSDASINSDSSTPFLNELAKPTFTCVQRIEAILSRPVMILGPHADALICKLTSESPDKFCRCEIEQVRGSMSAIDRYQSDEMTLDVRKKDTCFECISVNAVADINKKNRHCLLDVHPSAIDKLHRYQLYPIVILIKHKSAKQIREAKDTRFLPEKVSNKCAKELFEHFQKIETDYKQQISAVVTGGNMAYMCMQLKSAIDAEQKKIVWVNNPAANI